MTILAPSFEFLVPKCVYTIGTAAGYTSDGRHGGPEVLFETCVVMKFVDDDDTVCTAVACCRCTVIIIIIIIIIITAFV